MDAPLVLSYRLIPSEVDDQSHGLGVVKSYPISFYEAAAEYKDPWELDIEQLKKRIGTEREFEPMHFTHPTTNINFGVKHSAYKAIPSMKEKLDGQMRLAEIIRAVKNQLWKEVSEMKGFRRIAIRVILILAVSAVIALLFLPLANTNWAEGMRTSIDAEGSQEGIGGEDGGARADMPAAF